jgi:hypothetical protein
MPVHAKNAGSRRTSHELLEAARYRGGQPRVVRNHHPEQKRREDRMHADRFGYQSGDQRPGHDETDVEGTRFPILELVQRPRHPRPHDREHHSDEHERENDRPQRLAWARMDEANHQRQQTPRRHIVHCGASEGNDSEISVSPYSRTTRNTAMAAITMIV